MCKPEYIPPESNLTYNLLNVENMISSILFHPEGMRKKLGNG